MAEKAQKANATTERGDDGLVERTVIGPKSYDWFDPNGAPGSTRKRAEPGAVIRVTPAAAAAFPHRLGNSIVMKAQAAVHAAERVARDERAKVELEAKTARRASSSTVQAEEATPASDSDAAAVTS